MWVRRLERGAPLFDTTDGHRGKLRAWGLLQGKNMTPDAVRRRGRRIRRRAAGITRLAIAAGHVRPPPHSGALATPLDLLLLVLLEGMVEESRVWRHRRQRETHSEPPRYPPAQVDLHRTHERGARMATVRLEARLKFVNIAHRIKISVTEGGAVVKSHGYQIHPRR